MTKLRSSAPWLVLLTLTALNGCASPVEGLWPPADNEPRHRILVSIDRWHSEIGVWPEDDPRGERIADIEEWGFAEQAYYLKGEAGSSWEARAILVPSDGVVLRSRRGRPFSQRAPDPPAREWSFEIGAEGYRRLRAHLEAARSSDVALQEGPTTYFASRSSYHALHHCHHFTARALRAAGLPVWSSYSLFKWSLEMQLDRATGLQAEADRANGSN